MPGLAKMAVDQHNLTDIPFDWFEASGENADFGIPQS
jgi:hypothetical protein